jgi:hypothetical protein
MPVDTFDVVLNSATTMMFSMILLLILRFRPVCMNDMLIGIVCCQVDLIDVSSIHLLQCKLEC